MENPFARFIAENTTRSDVDVVDPTLELFSAVPVEVSKPGTGPSSPALPVEAPPGSDMAWALDSILSSLKIQPSAVRSFLEDVVLDFLEAKSLSATVVQVKDGVLTLESDPASAWLIFFDRAQLLQHLASKAPGRVTAVKVRSRFSHVQQPRLPRLDTDVDIEPSSAASHPTANSHIPDLPF